MIRKSSGTALLIPAAIIVALVAGCGYHFAGGRASRDPGALAIAGPVIENQTRQPGLELALEEAIAQRFIIEGRPLHKPTGEGQARLRCTIRTLDIKPISYRRNLTAREYRITMTLDAALEQKDKAPALWKAVGLTLVRTYRVQNTIEATEREKKAALETLGFDAAMFIADGVLRGF